MTDTTKPVSSRPVSSRPVSPDPRPAPAYKDGKLPGPPDGDVQVRPSGPDAMRDKPKDWDKVDEQLDESFPASDPPAR